MRTLTLLVALCTLLACKKSGEVQPATDAGSSAASTTPAAEEPTMDVLHGTWNHATDPKGEVGTEPLYETSSITFGEDGSYAFQLEEGGMALTGTWSLREKTDEGFIVDTDYGNGRENVLHLELREDGGKVVGFVVREGEERVGGRYYAR